MSQERQTGLGVCSVLSAVGAALGSGDTSGLVDPSCDVSGVSVAGCGVTSGVLVVSDVVGVSVPVAGRGAGLVCVLLPSALVAVSADRVFWLRSLVPGALDAPDAPDASGILSGCAAGGCCASGVAAVSGVGVTDAG